MTFVSATQIKATAPAEAVGIVDITVTTSGETSATTTNDQFTYVPSVTGISPSSGPAGGGTLVTIDGIGLHCRVDRRVWNGCRDEHRLLSRQRRSRQPRRPERGSWMSP